METLRDAQKNPQKHLDLVVENGGFDTVAISSPANQRLASLIFSVYSSGTKPLSPAPRDSIEFVLEYISFNLSTNQFETKNQKCHLVARPGAGDNPGDCRFQKTYQLPSGKTVYYMVDFYLTSLHRDNDSSLIFTFRASRFYGLNPLDSSAFAERIDVDKGLLKTFSRTITSLPGERVEIELPAETDSLFRLPIRETVAIYDPEEYVEVDQPPETIERVNPIYPEQPRKQGINANVFVGVLIGKDGIPKKALIRECDRPGIGFEEAALEAAYKCRYSPAMKNSQPTAIWVSYAIKFKLQ